MLPRLFIKSIFARCAVLIISPVTTFAADAGSGYPERTIVVPEAPEVDPGIEPSPIYVHNVVNGDTHTSRDEDQSARIIEQYNTSNYEDQNAFCAKFIYNIAGYPYVANDKKWLMVQNLVFPEGLARKILEKDIQDGRVVVEDNYDALLQQYESSLPGYKVYNCVSVDALPENIDRGQDASQSARNENVWTFAMTNKPDGNGLGLTSLALGYSSLFNNYVIDNADDLMINALAIKNSNNAQSYDDACKALVYYYIVQVNNKYRNFMDETPWSSLGYLNTDPQDYVNTTTFSFQDMAVSDDAIRSSIATSVPKGVEVRSLPVFNRSENILRDGDMDFSPNSTTTIDIAKRFDTTRETIVCATTTTGSTPSASRNPLTTMVLGYDLNSNDFLYIKTVAGWDKTKELDIGNIDELIKNKDFDSMNTVCRKAFDRYINQYPEVFKEYVPSQEDKGFREKLWDWITGDIGLGDIQFVLVEVNISDTETKDYFKSEKISVPENMYQCLPLDKKDTGDRDPIDQSALGKHDIYLSDIYYTAADGAGVPDYNTKYNAKLIPINTPFAVSFVVKNKGPAGGNIEGVDFSLVKEGLAGKKSSLKPLSKSISCSHVAGLTTDSTVYLGPSDGSFCTVTVSYKAEESGLYNFIALSKTKRTEKRIETDTTNNSLAVRLIVSKSRSNAQANRE